MLNMNKTYILFLLVTTKADKTFILYNNYCYVIYAQRKCYELYAEDLTK